MSRTDRNLNFNDIWMKISEGLEHIYRNQEMLLESYLHLYAVVYNYCTNSQPQSDGSEIRGTLTQNNRQNNVHDGVNRVGGELYTKLKNYLKNYLKELFE
ncbi:unnamed protein product, partial [Rotaria sp. Silwood2]